MLEPADTAWTPVECAHLLRRAGFGASPTEIAHVHALGREAAVDSLLNPDEALSAFPLPGWAEREAAAREAKEKRQAIGDLKKATEGLDMEEADMARRQLNNAFNQRDRERIELANRWWLDRLRRSRASLREKMTLFWHDHFATSAQKVPRPELLLWQNELFRRHALGDFRELCRAIVRDPAMLLYLDGRNSSKAKPNENFARELMELFTLGEGHYSENDIRQAARAFTGYRLAPLTGEVNLVRRQWDPRPKTIFGTTGKFDGEGVIDLLFQQPAAATFLPGKLWAYFVSDTPPADLVEELGNRFAASGFQIRPLLREIFLSKAFYDPSVIRNQIKSPIQFLLQLCRELELPGLPSGFAGHCQQQLGQVLFRPPNVAGWDWGRAWINTNTLLARYNIVGLITCGGTRVRKVPGDPKLFAPARRRNVQALERMSKRWLAKWPGPDYRKIVPTAARVNPEQVVDILIQRLFQAPLDAKTREAFLAHADTLGTNDDVGIAWLCHLMLSTPQYQLA